MIRSIQLTVVCVAVMVASAGRADAAFVTYVDEADYNSNVTATQATIDFESTALGTHSSLPFGAVTFSSPSPSLFVQEGPGLSRYLGHNFGGPLETAITISGNNAIGLLVGTGGADTGILSYTVADSDGNTISSNFAPGTTNSYFLGLSTTTGNLTSLTIANGTGGFWQIDNVSLGNATAVPEPCSLAVLGIGACVVAARRRRRQQHETSPAV